MTGLPPLYRWEPIGHPRALVHVVHGMSEHGARYGRFAAALNRAGFTVWAHDHRGHGQNPAPPVGLGHFADKNGWRAVGDDAWAVSSALRATRPDLPLIEHLTGPHQKQRLPPWLAPAPACPRKILPRRHGDHGEETEFPSSLCALRVSVVGFSGCPLSRV